MTSNKVTLRSIAKSLNLHHTTVSRAMKNNPRISQEVRDRVQKAAREAGYAPDPLLSALRFYQRRQSAPVYQATLGWMTSHPTRDGWNQFQNVAYFKGALRRATELGYQLEQFWLGEPRLSQKRLIQILEARNIRGLIFIPQPRSRSHLLADWSRFNGVTFGRILAWPPFHRVYSDHFSCLALLMRQLKRLGYKRPGFAIWTKTNEYTNRAWVGAFHAYQSLPGREQIPVLMQEPWNPREVKKWFTKYRPDVVISHDETLLTWMESWGLKVPEDVGFALAARHGEASERCSGIDENNEAAGEVAINILVDLLQRHENTTPSAPISTLVGGSWAAGQTLRRQV